MEAVQEGVFDWIFQQEYEFGGLTPEEKQAISDFSVLWSYFEARVCGTDAKVDKLRRIAHEVARSDNFDPSSLHTAMIYFRNRYVSNGEPTGNFYFLHIRKQQEHSALLTILNSDERDVSKELEAALYIIYRYRNNLFHGVKWSYGIRRQKENFLNATELLKSIIVVAGRMEHDIEE